MASRPAEPWWMFQVTMLRWWGIGGGGGSAGVDRWQPVAMSRGNKNRAEAARLTQRFVYRISIATPVVGHHELSLARPRRSRSKRRVPARRRASARVA